MYPVSTLAVDNNLLVQNGAIVSNIRRNVPGKDETVHVIFGESSGSRTELVRAVIERARRCVGGRERQPVQDRFWDGLGLCTWESFGANRVGPIPTQYTKEKLLGVLPSFPIDIFLIDDGWQDHNKDSGGRKSYPPRARLRSFQPNENMRGTMRDTIREIKMKGVSKVGVWMALEGYWFAIDPEGDLARKYNCTPHPSVASGQVRGGVIKTLEMADPPREQWLPSPDKAYQFWFDYFSEVKSWGIDFVKVDNQAGMEGIQSSSSRHVMAAMWSNVLLAVQAVWGDVDRIIMCMSHNERMLNGPGGLDFDRPTGNLVFRNSDDYNMPYSNPHGEFVLWNTRNTILTSHLSLVPDFDMFASNPASHRPLYHALLRAMSNGTILLSDTPETETDLALLNAMTGRTSDNLTKVVRSPVSAVQIENRWFDLDLGSKESGKAHLAGAWDVGSGAGVIGAWNCREPGFQAVCQDSLSFRDIKDLTNDNEGPFIVYPRGYSASLKGATVSLARPNEAFDLPFSLQEGECEAFIVSGLRTLDESRVAILGMQDKLWPLGGVSVRQEGSHLTVESRFSTAEFAIFVDGVIAIDTGKEVSVWRGEGDMGSVYTMSLEADQVITISHRPPPMKKSASKQNGLP